jgi:hypothetical protein
VDRLAWLVIVTLTTVIALTIIATGLLAWHGQFSEAGRERLWNVIGVYTAGCFTLLGLLVGKREKE